MSVYQILPAKNGSAKGVFRLLHSYVIRICRQCTNRDEIANVDGEVCEESSFDRAGATNLAWDAVS
jgi:hypothetical protein